jgi:Macrocin-O-methyltransferase (TylF)
MAWRTRCLATRGQRGTTNLLGRDRSGQVTGRTVSEDDDLRRLRELLLSGGALDQPTWNYQLLTYLRRQSLAKILWWEHLYRQIVDVPGCILEFGVHFGTSLSTLMSLRGLFEPYNYQRDIVGFDTFEGFSSVGNEDQSNTFHWKAGDYATPEGFAEHLSEVLGIQERMSPLAHIQKHELVVGDASDTFPKWLSRHPEQLVALVIFDMDVYEPTANVLRAVQDRLTKGSIVVLDELASKAFPGETQAFVEVVGFRNVRLRRFPFQPTAAYYVVD